MIEEINATTREAGSQNEVFAAYDELLRKLKETQKTPLAIKQEEKIIEEKKQVIEVAVRELGEKEDTLSIHLANLKVSLNKTLEDISTKVADAQIKLGDEKKKFASLRQAMKFQEEELNHIYKIRPAADTLAALLMANKEKSFAFEQEIQQKRAAWKKEQEDHALACKERDAQLARERQRNEEEYLYNQELSKRTLEHELNAKRLQQEESLKEREMAFHAREREFLSHCESEKLSFEQRMSSTRLQMEEEFKIREANFEAARRKQEEDILNLRKKLEEEHKIREAKLNARDAEFHQLKENNERFPQELQRAIQDSERVLTQTLTLKFQYESKLLEKDFETERMLHQQTISALETKIKQLESLNYSFRPLAYNPENTSSHEV